MADPVATPTTTTPPAPGTPATLPPPVAADPKVVAKPQEDERVAQLIAKESALVKQQQALKAEREAYAREKAEAAELKALLQSAKRDPESVAKKIWGDQYYEQFTEMRLSGSKVTPELIAQAVDDKLSDFEKRQNEAREAQLAQERERLQQEQQRVVTAWREDIRGYVTARGEEYELINLHGWQDQVVKAIEDHFAKTQKIMSTKEAADIVEAQIAEAIQKSLATKKFQAKQEAPQEKPIGLAQPRTLTNALTPASTPSTPPSNETEEERIARAIARGREVAQRRAGA